MKSHFNSEPLTVLGKTEEDTDQLRWYTYDKLGSISCGLRFGYRCHITERSTTTTIKHYSAANDSYINQVYVWHRVHTKENHIVIITKQSTSLLVTKYKEIWVGWTGARVGVDIHSCYSMYICQMLKVSY